MPQIPILINGVSIEFKSTVNKDVKDVMILGLKHILRRDIARNHTLSKIFISSAFDSHTMPSRHMQQKAVDISRINGKHMDSHYGTNSEVTEITNALQKAIESFPAKRENFGPLLKKKLGKPFSINGHKDHIHFSVN